MNKPSVRVEVFPVPRNKKKPLWRWRRVGANNRAICQSVSAFNQARYAGYAARQEYPAVAVVYLDAPTDQRAV